VDHVPDSVRPEPVPQTEDLPRRHQAGEHPDHLLELDPALRLCFL